MNKIKKGSKKQKIVATLCALGCTVSGG